MLSNFTTPTSRWIRSLLDDKERFFCWWLPSNSFYSVQAVSTQRIKTDTVLRILDMFGQFGFQLDELFLREEAFEQGILCPGAETSQDLVNLGSPSIAGDVICNNIACLLPNGNCLECHGFVSYLTASIE